MRKRGGGQRCHGVNARSHLPQEAVARGPGRARVAQYRSKCNTLCDAPQPPSPPYGDVWCAGHREQAHVSTTKSSSVVP